MNIKTFLTPQLGCPTPELNGKLLVLLCSYRGGIDNNTPFSFGASIPWAGPFSRLLDRLTFLNLRRFVATNRDFFANVRSVGYQISLLEESFRLMGDRPVEIRIDRNLCEASSLERLGRISSVKSLDANSLFEDCENFANVLIIYPDALGLGWGRLENLLPNKNVYILNGRRRIFSLDDSTRCKLFWRRLLANTRLPEMIAGMLIIPLAAACALQDAFRKRD
jgi:hypothetical protein